MLLVAALACGCGAASSGGSPTTGAGGSTGGQVGSGGLGSGGGAAQGGAGWRAARAAARARPPRPGPAASPGSGGAAARGGGGGGASGRRQQAAGATARIGGRARAWVRAEATDAGPAARARRARARRAQALARWPLAADRVIVTGVRATTTPAATSSISLHNGRGDRRAGHGPRHRRNRSAHARAQRNRRAGHERPHRRARRCFRSSIRPTFPATLGPGMDLPVTVQLMTTGANLPAAPTNKDTGLHVLDGDSDGHHRIYARGSPPPSTACFSSRTTTSRRWARFWLRSGTSLNVGKAQKQLESQHVDDGRRFCRAWRRGPTRWRRRSSSRRAPGPPHADHRGALLAGGRAPVRLVPVAQRRRP